MKRQIFRLNTFLTRTVGGFKQVVISPSRCAWENEKFQVIVIRQRVNNEIKVGIRVNKALVGVYNISTGSSKKSQVELFKKEIISTIDQYERAAKM